MKNNIRKLLNENNMKEKELADKLGVTETSVSRYINGIRIPNVITAIKMAKIFNCGVEDIFIVENEPDDIRIEVVEQYRKYQEEFKDLLHKMQDLKLTEAEKAKLELKIYTVYV